jgi:hypothetical protein
MKTALPVGSLKTACQRIIPWEYEGMVSFLQRMNTGEFTPTGACVVIDSVPVDVTIKTLKRGHHRVELKLVVLSAKLTHEFKSIAADETTQCRYGGAGVPVVGGSFRGCAPNLL